MKPIKLLALTLGLMIISSFTSPDKSSRRNNANFAMYYKGYFIVGGDGIVSVFADQLPCCGGNVVDGAFGKNVGGPYYTATGTMHGQIVENFHMVALGNTFDYSGILMH